MRSLVSLFLVLFLTQLSHAAVGKNLNCVSYFNNGEVVSEIKLTSSNKDEFVGNFEIYRIQVKSKQEDANHKHILLSVASVSDHQDLSVESEGVFPILDHPSQLHLKLSSGTLSLICYFVQ